MTNTRLATGPRPLPNSLTIRPVSIWLLILGLIFTTEYGIMLLLTLLPVQPAHWVDAAIDGIALTMILAPVLWWGVVRPLRHALSLQSRVLERSLSDIEAERRHIAHELHDGVGQSLTLLISGLRSLKGSGTDENVCRRSQELHQLAQTALKDVKKLSLGLRPSLLDDLGLAPAIERIISDVRENHPLEVSVDVQDLVGRRLSENVETALFRILQESMSNVVKHSGARHASVRLGRENGMIILEVKDDGCGIAPALRCGTPGAGHLGLVGMRERAALVGGALEIESTPGHGASVIARIPERRTP